MLQEIRDRAQGWLSLLVVGVIAIVFLFWGVTGYLGGHHGDQPVAKVDGVEISQRDFTLAYDRLRNGLRAQNAAPLSEWQAEALKQEVLNALVGSRAMLAAVHNEGYRISHAQVDKVLLSIPAFQAEGVFSPVRFEQLLRQQSYTPMGYRQAVRRDLLLQQLQQGLVYSALTFPNEVQRLSSLLQQRRDVSYALIHAQRLAKQIHVTETQIKQFYEAAPTRFMRPEQIRLSYIEVKQSDFAPKTPLSDQQLHAYYLEHKAEYSQPEQRQVAQILIRSRKTDTAAVVAQAQKKLARVQAALKKGDDFTTVAKQFSEDPLSAARGGVLPWAGRGTWPAAFTKAAFSIAKPNRVVGPIKTRFGYHFIRLLAVKPGKAKAFSQVKALIRETMRHDMMARAYTDAVEHLQDTVYENTDGLAALADSQHFKVQQTGFFDKQGAKTGMAAQPKVIQAAFSNEVKEQGYSSDVIELSPERVVVIERKDLRPAKRLPLATVKAAIEQHLVSEAAAKKAQTLGQKVLKAVSKGQPLTDVAHRYGLRIKRINSLTRNDKMLPGPVIKAAFRLPKQAQSQKQAMPRLAAVPLASGDYAVLQLNAVSTKTSLQKKQAAHYQQQLTRDTTALIYRLYQQQAIKQAKVKLLRKT